MKLYSFRGVLHPEMPDILLFFSKIIIIFLKIYFFLILHGHKGRFQWKKTLYSSCMQHDMPQPCKFLRYPLRRKRLVLGRSVELRTPLEVFFNFFKFLLFHCVYAHI